MGPDPRIRFRAAAIADQSALITLETSAFAAPWTGEQIGGFWAGPGGLGWMAETDDGVAVGFALFRQVADEAELLRVGTHPAWQGRRVASPLLATALAELDGASIACYLEVRADNLPAQELYRRLGFELVGRRASYYDDGSDAWLYARSARG